MVKVIVGMMGSSVAGGARSLAILAGTSEFLLAVRAYAVHKLDTAHVYVGGLSEEMPGAVGAGDVFDILIKASAFAPASLCESRIIKNCNQSLATLSQTLLEEQSRAIAQLYKEEKFERSGLSNISDQEVQTIYDVCKREGYPLPKVYQGGFSPISRGAEGDLLARKLDDVVNPAFGTRFDLMKVFGDMYLTPEIKTGSAKVQECCDKESIRLMEVTMTCFIHHSTLRDEDGVVLSASTEEQVDANLTACEQGPLPQNVLQSFTDLHESIKDNLPGIRANSKNLKLLDPVSSNVHVVSLPLTCYTLLVRSESGICGGR